MEATQQQMSSNWMTADQWQLVDNKPRRWGRTDSGWGLTDDIAAEQQRLTFG
jgi:hypothetical protein